MTRQRVAIVMCSLAGAGAVWLCQAQETHRWRPAILLPVLALVSGTFAWVTAPFVPDGPLYAAVEGLGRDRRLRKIGLGLLVAGFVFGAWAIPRWLETWTRLLPVWTLCMATVLVGSALVGWIGPRAELQPEADRRERRIYTLLVTLCIVVGVGYRVYDLPSMPPGIFVDEINGALDALYLLEGRPDSPFGTGWYETPRLYAYYMASLFKLAGINFATLKAASVAPAVLTVAALFPLARMLFGAPTALIATFLFAVSRWHVTMSRWGWNEVMPPLFQVLSTLLLLRALSSGSALVAALGGLVLGFGMYTYIGSRLVVATVVAYVAYRALTERGFLRRRAGVLTLFGASFLLSFGPLLATYLKDPFTMWNRTSQVSILRDVENAKSWAPLQENIRRHALMLHERGDRNSRHNVDELPMLGPVPQVLVLLGLGLVLRRVRDHRFALLLLWYAIGMAGGVFTRLEEGPQAYRTLGVTPALCLVAGVAAYTGYRTFAEVRWARWPAVALLAGFLVAEAVSTYRLYFHRMRGAEATLWGFNATENAVARRLLAERAATGSVGHVYLSPTFYYFGPVRYLLYRPKVDGQGGLDDPEFHAIEPQSDLPLPFSPSRDLLLLLEVSTLEQNLELIRRSYPNAQSKTVHERGQALFAEVVIPRGDVAALRGLTAVDTRGVPVSPEMAPPPTVAAWLQVLEPGQRLVGAFQAARSGRHRFILEGPAALLLDGEPAREVVLGQGLHDIELSRSPGAHPFRFELETPDGRSTPARVETFYRLSAPKAGLRGAYYEGREWLGPPVFERIDPFVQFDWPGPEPLPDPFSVRWTGELRAEAPGTYEFKLDCDDGCAFFVDGHTLASVLTEGVHSLLAEVALRSGRHQIRIDYFQGGGGKSIHFYWRPPGSHLRPVPPEVLVPGPRTLLAAPSPKRPS